jgi:hypothetical protein
MHFGYCLPCCMPSRYRTWLSSTSDRCLHTRESSVDYRIQQAPDASDSDQPSIVQETHTEMQHAEDFEIRLPCVCLPVRALTWILARDIQGVLRSACLVFVGFFTSEIMVLEQTPKRNVLFAKARKQQTRHFGFCLTIHYLGSKH